MDKKPLPISTALFDFDGVIADTEPLYNHFWNDAAERYQLGIENFALRIKGTVLPHILQTYFSKHSEKQIKQLLQECDEFEMKLTFQEIPGALQFVKQVHKEGIKTGLVTSSTNRKMRMAYELMKLEGLFDALVTADHITEGKPSPQCYLLAADLLKSVPRECIVFEDSFAGIQAGLSAKMQVIGLSTTNPESEIKRYTPYVIPNFQHFDISDFLNTK